MIGLPRAQLKLLDFITAYTAEHRVAPNFEEMRIALGLASRSGIHRLLSALHERGAIRRAHHRARAIEVLTPTVSRPKAVVPDLDFAALSTTALIGTRALIDCEIKRRREAA